MTEETTNTQHVTEPVFDPSDPGPLIAQLAEASGPVDLVTLGDSLNVAEEHRSGVRETLDALALKGAVIETRDGKYGIPEKMNLVVGRLTCHEKGFGFVIPSDPTQKDLYIPRRKLGNALHGDTVVARREPTRGQKSEGRVIRLLKRARTQVVGRFERGDRLGYVVPLDPRIGYQVFVSEADVGGAEPGQLVCAEITSYPEANGRRSPEGKIIEVIGDPDDPRLDVEVIIREFNLPHEFPAEVLAEAEKISLEVSEADIEGRTDFREVPVVTIDGENAKDFDDAVHVEKLASGNYQLSIHIADVSAYVPVGSAIDQEAQLRATSVYFPDRVVPMLPERLSNEVCSLKPGVDRLVQSIVIEINGQGHTVNFDFHDGVIRSAARMTYKEVAAIVDGSDEALAEKHAAHADHFRLMSSLCDVLRRYRGRRGSIDFDLPEPQMRINMLGEVEDIFRSDRNQAHRLIEEFMIRANEVVASHMAWEDVASPYRVHEGPDPEKVEKFRDFIGGLGLHLGGKKVPAPGDFQRLVAHLEGQPGERVIIYQMLRTMKQARYQPDNKGHFGLASPRYTHFTSPIRRYPDLVVHRLLKADLERKTQQEFDVDAVRGQLAHICTDNSERERNAEEAERRYVDWKTTQFMADKLGDNFEALVTGVHAYGFFVELDQFFVEGLVHVSSMDDDYYQFDEGKHTLRGDKGGRTLTLGSRVRVQVARVDRERRRLDFTLVEGPLESKITPLAKAAVATEEEEEATEAPSGRRRRRRRPRKKTTTEGASQEPANKTTASDAKPDEAAAKPKRTRRRKASGRTEAGDKDGEGAKRSARGSRSSRGRRTSERKTDERKAGERKTDERKTGERKTNERKDAGRQPSRRRSTKKTDRGGSRSAAPASGGQEKPSQSREAPAEKPAQAPKAGAQKPKVNPYLTDL